MATSIEQFDYDLPESFIAQESVEPRDHSKLMVVNRDDGRVEHKHFFNIIDELKSGDVLVFNTSKVFKARLVDQGIEVFVLKINDGEIEALVKPGKKFAVGSAIGMFGKSFVVESKTADGVFRLLTKLSITETLDFCDAYGSIPTPPYVSQKLDDEKKYQTVYAKEVGSVAAPTAGFHFTETLLDKLKAKGVQIEQVILHVGIGTFRPVQTSTIEEHVMHSEWVSLSKETAERINKAKAESRRIIAVGTTTTRVLEGIVATKGELVPYEGEINIFITPGFQFKVINGLITNFHLPKSTLLVLISAFAGRENVLAAYEAAKRNNYRFFSFGDAMFIK